MSHVHALSSHVSDYKASFELLGNILGILNYKVVNYEAVAIAKVASLAMAGPLFSDQVIG